MGSAMNMCYCAHDGCLSKSIASGKGWCSMHYNRNKRNQPMDAPHRRQGANDLTRTCTVIRCTKPLKASQGKSRSKTLCSMHFTRAWRLKKGLSSLALEDISHIDVSRPVTYLTAHLRVKRTWGVARLHDCVNCGARADDWAYDGCDETQLLGIGSDRRSNRLSWYSRYPEFYMPLCRTCHGRFDGGAAALELNTYRRQVAAQHDWTVVE